MPEERKTIEARLSASPEVYRHTKFMARFEKAFPWLLAGGAALVLLETYRKNTNDRAKANADIKAALKNQEHQAEVLKEQIRQFDENAFQERKAERRERYTKAVEQLGNEKAPVRMGGVYTLIGLADEWLLDENLDYAEKVREGQVIINNLCAYIRSPFTLTSYYDELSEDAPSLEGSYKDKKEEFYVDKAILDSEADVRLSIIKEIHDRIQVPDKNTPGAWSDFEYDFSGSTFFYPIDLTNSYYAKPINFSGSTYKGWANFTDSTYQALANFSGSTYQALANFSGSTYQALANFSGSTYQALANFTGSTYEDEAYFTDSTYQGGANFRDSTYQGGANFRDSTYQGGANFRDSTYQGGAYFTDSTYQGWANFRGSTYQGEAYFTDSTYQALADFSDSTYEGWADFTGSTYQALADFTDSTYKSEADFTDSTYQGWADFGNSIYQEEADLSRSTYEGWAYFTDSTYKSGAYFTDSTYNDVADFSGSIFYQKVYFGADGDNNSFSRFTDCAPQFYDETNHKNTLFGSPNNDFTVENGRGYPIYRSLQSLPLGCAFLTAEQKEYLADKFQEIDETKNKFLEAKDPKEKAELSKNLQALDEKLHEWREEATTVKVEGTAPGEEDN
ncbi:pentapeptide repeat-containing protein [Rothia aeria]|uniref:pentapeptide repeat-containing protein n=1 Tax=Rothia aeria TaxID=172042 RepID=UPI00254DCFE8|nr:pentapeptide repeat-containing protein [Rothia aeria]MDK7353694.1 hypothetical protein [Rothia aeria]